MRRIIATLALTAAALGMAAAPASAAEPQVDFREQCLRGFGKYKTVEVDMRIVETCTNIFTKEVTTQG